MQSRHKVRELALQVLFAFDAQPEQANAESAAAVTRGVEADPVVIQQVTTMASGAWDQRKVADAWTTRLAPNWPAHRQPGVDRAILRLAIWEMTNSDTPPKVVIDEAIELAKQFSTADSPAFVNGVLDAVMKEVAALKS